MEKFKVAESNNSNAIEAVSSIKEQLSGVDASLILYFVSSSYQVDVVSKEMAGAFSGVQTVGCTTAGELISGKIGKDSIVAMAWSKASLKYLKVEVLENIKENCEKAVENAFKSIEKSLGKTMNELDPTKYAGLIIIDGLSGCEETLNDLMGNYTNVPIIGGSSGDDFKFEQTALMVNGKTYANAAVFMLLEPTNGYVTLKTQSFSITDKKLVPTKVNEARRMVVEFNGKPAAQAYAQALGISEEELAKNLGQYPVGLVFDENNFFVRSPQQIEGTSVLFYCAVKEGQELTVLNPADIVEGTRADLQKCGDAEALVDFCCCLRILELKRKEETEAYSELFKNIPAIGFSTYGESYIGHINQTSTILLLK